MAHLIAALIAVGLAALSSIASAQDTDQFRFYFGPSSGIAFQLKSEAAPGIEVTSGQQLTGFFLGVNLNRYFGVELAGDAFQTDLSTPSRGKVGEFGMFTIIPEVRARYPLLNGRLTPYVIGGVGAQLGQFNDRKPGGLGAQIQAGGSSVVGSVGAGVEYYVADNIAIGMEGRYLISRGQEITIDGQGGSANLDALLLNAKLRLLFPDGPDAPRAYEPPYLRPYFGVRIGGQLFTSPDIADGLEMKPEDASIGGALNQYFNVAGGLDIGRYMGAELVGEGFKGVLSLQDVGDIRKLSLYIVTPTFRLRYPLLDHRLVPYALAGVGVSYAETHDAKPPGYNVEVTSGDYSPVGAIGLGFDYFLARNIAVGLETKYLIIRGHQLTVAGRTQSVNLDSFVASVGLRVYFR